MNEKPNSLQGNYKNFIGYKLKMREFEFLITKDKDKKIGYWVHFNGSLKIRQAKNTIHHKILASIFRGHIDYEGINLARGKTHEEFVDLFINRVFHIKNTYSTFNEFIYFNKKLFQQRFLSLTNYKGTSFSKQLNNLLANSISYHKGVVPLHNKNEYKENVDLGDIVLGNVNVLEWVSKIVESQNNVIEGYRNVFRDNLSLFDKDKNAIIKSKYRHCEAAHIYNVAWSKNDGKLDDISNHKNGIFLEPNIHRLFDKHILFLNSKFEFVDKHNIVMHTLFNKYKDKDRLYFIKERNKLLLSNGTIDTRFFSLLSDNTIV